jgi:hypothetical protein
LPFEFLLCLGIFRLRGVFDHAPELRLLTDKFMTASAAAASSEAYKQIE